MTDEMSREVVEAQFATIRAILDEREKITLVVLAAFERCVEDADGWRVPLAEAMAGLRQVDALKDQLDTLERAVADRASKAGMVSWGQLGKIVMAVIAAIGTLFGIIAGGIILGGDKAP